MIAIATALLVVVTGSAQAAAVKVKPTASVLGATKSGKHVKFQIGVKFPIPLAATAADCTGKVAVSTKLSKKKTAKWSGKLAANGPDCVATVKAKLAAAKHGKKLKFKIAFKGSKKFKPFSKSLKLKIVAPPPPQPQLSPPGPPEPQPVEMVGVHNKGWWDINSNDNDNDDFEFFIEDDYSVSEITSTTAGKKIQLECETENPQASLVFNTGFEAKLDSITVQSTQTYAAGKAMVHTFHFSWTSPLSGVGEYSSTGQYNVGTEEIPKWENCTGEVSFVLEHFEKIP